MRNPQARKSRPHWRGVLPLGFALALVLALWLGPTGLSHARAQDPSAASDASGATPSDDSSLSGSDQSTSPSAATQGYVAEIVDSAFVVGPAEFLALDLPANPPGQRAAHLLGTVNVAKGDIMVRLFTAAAYQGWLKRRGGEHANAFWTSKRDRAITLDQALPDGPLVILLDNGYSVRTPKHVRAQLQIQYQPVGEGGIQAAQTRPAGQPPVQDDIITPRSNADDEIPPPPPPPPADSGNN